MTTGPVKLTSTNHTYPALTALRGAELEEEAQKSLDENLINGVDMTYSKGRLRMTRASIYAMPGNGDKPNLLECLVEMPDMA